MAPVSPYHLVTGKTFDEMNVETEFWADIIKSQEAIIDFINDEKSTNTSKKTATDVLF